LFFNRIENFAPNHLGQGDKKSQKALNIYSLDNWTIKKKHTHTALFYEHIKIQNFKSLAKWKLMHKAVLSMGPYPKQGPKKVFENFF